MKYLKRYNEGVDELDINDIKQNCEDILLELDDIGFKTRVELYRGRNW